MGSVVARSIGLWDRKSVSGHLPVYLGLVFGIRVTPCRARISPADPFVDLNAQLSDGEPNDQREVKAMTAGDLARPRGVAA